MGNAQQHLAAVTSAHLCPPERTRTSRAIVALRQGPGLRKFLGSAGELWTFLQARARRDKGKPLEITVKKLALCQRPPRPIRTITWSLKRLVDAGVISTRRRQHGLEITLVSTDIDANGLREYSPELLPQTIIWMRSQRAPGRPKKLVAPAHPKPARRETVVMQGATEMVSGRELARILAHPLVPANPYTPALKCPLTPRATTLDSKARPSEHREFLIEAYASASRVFWPTSAVSSACTFMRSKDGRRVLDAAAAVFMREGIAPQAWLGVQFERVKNTRKQPLRPEHVYEPTLIEKHSGAFFEAARDGAFFLQQETRDPQYEICVQGIRSLYGLWERTMRELRALSCYDEAEIARIVENRWPGGWRPVYKNAEDKIRSIQNELNTRVARGSYIWGE